LAALEHLAGGEDADDQDQDLDPELRGHGVALLGLVVSVRKSATRFAAVGWPGGPTMCG
jgi:hypothetical protein